MRLLAVPNWSFGRDRDLLRHFEVVLTSAGLKIHYLQSDVDHNRTVSAFSGDHEVLREALLRMAGEAFERIDLTRHVGVHPRIGALDVCPFVLPPGEASLEALQAAKDVAIEVADSLASRFGVPVYLYEKSERGRHESDLPSLRRGGFGALLERVIRPDFGPARAHPTLGVSVVGVRDWLIAMNVNLATPDLAPALAIARTIRHMRVEGDERFLGVRALGLPLASRVQSQVSMNVTLPDVTPIDPIVEWVRVQAAQAQVLVAETELIGVIRPQDLPTATHLPVRPEQVVPSAE